MDFCKDDIELLTLDANERSITHHIAKYLERYVPRGLAVDCEYNRKDGTPKRLIGRIEKNKGTDDTEGSNVFPDIIVHERSKGNNNLLVVEAKKEGKSYKNDEEKISAYVKELHYLWGLLLILPRKPLDGFFTFSLSWSTSKEPSKESPKDEFKFPEF